MHIHCTHGTPIADTLDYLPPLPLLINYSETITKQDELGLYHALRLHDHVLYIDLYLPPSILHKCPVLMDGPFPILEHLSLWSAAEKITTLTLPKAFLAPNLRHLDIPGITPLRRLRLLTSTVSLVTLMLRDIQASSYLRPRLLVARIGSLPQLEELSIQFSAPIPRPSVEMELLGEKGTPVILPNLKTLKFRGVSAYLESLVAQIMTPLLERLDITFFNRIAFTLPHLSHFISITEGLKLPAAEVFFSHLEVFIIMTHHISPSPGPFSLSVKCRQLDWQIDCAAQICSALIPALSGVDKITLNLYNTILPTEWEDGGIDKRTWNELLRSFVGARRLFLYGGLLEELSRALQAEEAGLDPGFLPDLQDIVAADNLFTSFVDTRRVVGRPVRFLPLQPLPLPPTPADRLPTQAERLPLQPPSKVFPRFV